MIEFVESEHTYWIDGRWAPGIHAVLRAVGILGEPPPSARDAMTRGTIAHKAIELDAKGELDEQDFLTRWPSLFGYIQAWRAWRDAETPEILAIEELVAHYGSGYATKVDQRVRIGGHEFAVNFKTGQPMDHYPIQAAAEVNCYGHEVLPLTVYLAATGEFRPAYPNLDVDSWSEAHLTWRDGLGVWAWLMRHGRIRIPERAVPPEPETVPVESHLFDVRGLPQPEVDELFGRKP